MRATTAKVIMNLAKEGHPDKALLLLDARARRMADASEPKFWERIIAKIPGVCYLLRKNHEQIERDIKDVKELMKQIEKIESENPKDPKLKGLYLKVLLITKTGADDIRQLKTYELIKLQRYVKKNKKNIKMWVRSGKLLAELKAENEPSGLGEACKKKKK